MNGCPVEGLKFGIDHCLSPTCGNIRTCPNDTFEKCKLAYSDAVVKGKANTTSDDLKRIKKA